MATIFAGKYEILRKLAQGGMAQVYLAKQQGIDGFEKVVVIKRILPHLAESDEFVQMFLDEARTAADLRHANIVNIYEVGEAEATYYMAMEYLHGRDIRRIQRQAEKRKMPIPLHVTLEILRQCAMGLHYAHSKTDLRGKALNIVHRDISPHNLIVTFEGTSKVVDFGIAKAESQTQQTASGVLKGKYSYMSPEQAAGKPLTALSDQYALGIVAWETLLMKRLFRRDNEIMTLHAILQDEVPKITSIQPDFPQELEAIVEKMLAPRAEDRFKSCEDVALAIEDFLVSERMPHSSVRVSRFLMDLFSDEISEEDSTGKIVLGNTSSASASTMDEKWDTLTRTEGTKGQSPGDSSKDKIKTSDTKTKLDPFSEDASMEASLTINDAEPRSSRLQRALDITQITRTHAGPETFFPTEERRPRNYKSSVLAIMVFFALAVFIGISQRNTESIVDVGDASPQRETKSVVEKNKGQIPQATKAPESASEKLIVGTHALVVTSEPPNAAVRYNGKDLGRTPLKIPVTPSLFPFSVEAYLPDKGLLKVDCFARPDEKKTEYPCILKYPKAKKASIPTKKVNNSVKKSTTKKASGKPEKRERPKLELID